MKYRKRLIGFLLCLALSGQAEYHASAKIGAGKLDHMSQVAAGKNDTIYALEEKGRLLLFSPDGTLKKTVDTGMKNTGALAVDEQGRVYVFSTLTEKKKVKVGARIRTVARPVGVQCKIYTPDGEPLETRSFKQLKSARAARVIGNTLAVADLVQKAIILLDLESGKETGRIKKGLRLCCGIFDFSVGPDQSIVVANLGAFKVQRFNLQGKLLQEFGKRGRELEHFQGCCNPVSVAYLPDGRLVAVEKDPSRIKIMNPDGTNPVEVSGIEELVKSCTFIPLAVDSKGNIYLGANAKGYIVKCEP
jgi:sugar lactone lactonase YvrE